MSDDFEADFDLLGDPIPPNWGKRGRPPHVPTDEKRRLVIQLLAFDWTVERIAAALNITPPTLRKNYFRELKFRDEARARVEAKVLQKLMAEVESGNVSAMDKYLKRLDKHDLERMQAHQPRPSAEEKPERLGKKEAARQAAQSAHEETEWGTLLH